MRIPDTLASLADYGIIDEVLRPLMSGKEAQVYLVRAGGEYRVAKVYKEAQNRTFKNRAAYTEGRKVRNTRDQRAMGKGSRHGQAQVEAAWRTTEVDMIYRLRAAGVRVPTPYNFIDGVLVMEMITDERGDPAPRLGDVILELAGAQAVFDSLLAEVVRMLAAGVVHGDLSDFNVLMGTDGPVIIDFPQAVDASSNQNARKLLLRDVDNLHRFMARFAPERRALPYAQEMWALYERGELTPDVKLTGRHQASERKVRTEDVLGLIGDAVRDERRRREHLGLSMRGAADLAGESTEKSAPPPSRYAQKREAKVAARQLEAANALAARASAARDVRGQAAHEAMRGRSNEQASGQRTAPARESAQGRGTDHAGAKRSPAVHERAHRRNHDQAGAQRLPSAHEAGRTRNPSPAHGANGSPAQNAPRDPARRSPVGHDRTQATNQLNASQQRPLRVEHGKPPQAQADANGPGAAKKRARRRRKRKPSAQGGSAPAR